MAPIEIQTFMFMDFGCRRGDPKNLTEVGLLAVNRSQFLQPEDIQEPSAKKLLDLRSNGFDLNIFNEINDFINQQQKPVCLVSHNGHQFDFPILKRELQRLKVSLPNDVLCADSLYIFYDISKTVSKKVVVVSDESEEQDTDADEEDSANPSTSSVSHTVDELSDQLNNMQVKDSRGKEPKEDVVKENMKPQNEEIPETMKPQNEETPENMKPQNEETPENMKPQNEETPKNMKTQNEETPENMKPQNEETLENMKPQNEETPENMKPQNEEALETMKPQNEETPENMKPQNEETPENVKPQNQETPENMKPQNEETPKNMKPQNQGTLENMKPQNEETPENMKPQNEDNPENMKPLNEKTPENQILGANNKPINVRQKIHSKRNSGNSKRKLDFNGSYKYTGNAVRTIFYGSNTKPTKGYNTLGAIYDREVKNPPIKHHPAANDIYMQFRISHKLAKRFLDWTDQIQYEFAKVEAKEVVIRN